MLPDFVAICTPLALCYQPEHAPVLATHVSLPWCQERQRLPIRFGPEAIRLQVGTQTQSLTEPGLMRLWQLVNATNAAISAVSSEEYPDLAGIFTGRLQVRSDMRDAIELVGGPNDGHLTLLVTAMTIQIHSVEILMPDNDFNEEFPDGGSLERAAALEGRSKILELLEGPYFRES